MVGVFVQKVISEQRQFDFVDYVGYNTSYTSKKCCELPLIIFIHTVSDINKYFASSPENKEVQHKSF